jgi:hypothetical protein
MDENQKTFIELLSLSLKGEKASLDILKAVDWAVVIELAQRHSLLPLIFTVLNHEQIDKDVLYNFKSIVFNISLQQIQNMEVLDKIVAKLSDAAIPLIVMKGIVLRNLYPCPETRTMSDFDLVVKSADIKSAIIILKKLGFRVCGYERAVHIQLINKDNMLIELHKNLFNIQRMGIPSNYMQQVWENAIPINICGRTVLSYSDIDNLLYLLLHAAKHFSEGGLGLRQLCDIKLLIETKRDMIDWEKFHAQTIEFNIFQFTQLIFEICNRLLGMHIPLSWENRKKINEDLINSLIQDILEGGVFGKDTEESNTSIRIKNLIGLEDYKGMRKFRGLIKILFPSSDKLDEKYRYAQKCFWLLPLAWIHRLFYNVINKRQRKMLKVILNPKSAKESFSIMRKRGKLISLVMDGKEYEKSIYRKPAR